MSYGSDFILTLFTADPELARAADAAGVDRIGLDLEKLGKHARQESARDWISDHQLEDLPAVADALSGAQLFCRTNPVHEGLRAEVDSLIEAGVEVLMLPMFRTVGEAAEFIEIVNGRATVTLLVETAAAAMRLHEIVALPGVDEIHIGLNDMHLDMGLANHFEVLTSGFVDMLADIIKDAGIPFGFAGIGRTGQTGLPVSTDLIYAQYPRVGATRALMARSYYAPDFRQLDLTAEVAATRAAMDRWHAAEEETLQAALTALRGEVRRWAPAAD